VGFANPFYPQNYPQKISGKYCCPAPDVKGILADEMQGGGFEGLIRHSLSIAH